MANSTPFFSDKIKVALISDSIYFDRLGLTPLFNYEDEDPYTTEYGDFGNLIYNKYDIYGTAHPSNDVKNGCLV